MCMHAHTISFLEKPCGLRYSSLREHLELKSIPNTRLHESMIKLSVCMYVSQRFDLSFFLLVLTLSLLVMKCRGETYT